MRVIKVSDYEINAKAGGSIVACFLSDLHECDTKPVKSLLDQYSPDCVLIGGDYIQNSRYCEKGFKFMTYCAEKYPTFCCLGNHELKYGGDIRADTIKTGVTLLDNSYAEFKKRRLQNTFEPSSGILSEIYKKYGCSAYVIRPRARRAVETFRARTVRSRAGTFSEIHVRYVR